MNFFIVALCINYIRTGVTIRKLSGTRQKLNWQVYVLAGDGQRGRDGMIRWEIFKQLTKFTYELEKDEEDEVRCLQFNKFNYLMYLTRPRDKRRREDNFPLKDPAILRTYCVAIFACDWSGQTLTKCLRIPQFCGLCACPKPWWFHSWNGIFFHIADCNLPNSVTANNNNNSYQWSYPSSATTPRSVSLQCRQAFLWAWSFPSSSANFSTIMLTRAPSPFWQLHPNYLPQLMTFHPWLIYCICDP